MKFRVQYKRWSDIAKNFVMVEEAIETSYVECNPIGALLFHNDNSEAEIVLPPGCWLICEPYDRILGPKDSGIIS